MTKGNTYTEREKGKVGDRERRKEKKEEEFEEEVQESGDADNFEVVPGTETTEPSTPSHSHNEVVE